MNYAHVRATRRLDRRAGVCIHTSDVDPDLDLDLDVVFPRSNVNFNFSHRTKQFDRRAHWKTEHCKVLVLFGRGYVCIYTMLAGQGKSVLWWSIIVCALLRDSCCTGPPLTIDHFLWRYAGCRSDDSAVSCSVRQRANNLRGVPRIIDP